MGYHTTFNGSIKIEPPLNKKEIEFLQKFNSTRRMKRTKGPYYVDNKGLAGQDREDDILDYNKPPEGQPGLWCQWRPTDDGEYLEWDGGEKFYDSPEWMKYIIDHFIGFNPIAKKALPFLNSHTCNGEIEAQGEDDGDRWMLVVKDNRVSIAAGHVVYGKPERV